MKGIDPISPISWADRGKAFVTRAVIAILAGNAIVTIGIATTPSRVLFKRHSFKSTFAWAAIRRGSVAK